MQFPFFWRRKLPAEVRSLENPATPLTASTLVAHLAATSEAGEPITADRALQVPALWSAVNFLSGTLASLPVRVFRRSKNGRERIRNGVAPLLAHAVNDATTSFDWRKHLFQQVLLQGRGLSFISRNGAGRVVGIFPLDATQVQILQNGTDTIYQYSDAGTQRRYAARDVIDLPFMRRADFNQSMSPLVANRDLIGLALAVQNYGSRFFAQGGVPPYTITGPAGGPAALARLSEDIGRAIGRAAQEKRPAIALPDGHKIDRLGGLPQEMQLVELQRFLVEQVARMYSMPPVLLQDLTHGTFTNAEQQDLHFVKHTLNRWVTQFEQELTLKLFGKNSALYVEVNLDGLLRGDFASRMAAYATGIQNGFLMPNEARDLDNRAGADGGDQLFIQGATVPLKGQSQSPATNPKEKTENVPNRARAAV